MKSKLPTFSEGVIIGLLPRGFIVIRDIEQDDFERDSSWAVVVSYTDYEDDGWYGGTHYHKSYHQSWRALHGFESQLHKLRVPKGDWTYTDTILYLVMALRERKKEDKIEDILAEYQDDHHFLNYYKNGDEIPQPEIPEKFIQLNKTGEIRDVMAELISIKNALDFEDNLKDIHYEIEYKSRGAYLTLCKELGDNHPSVLFVKKLIDKYNPDMNLADLKGWGRRLHGALGDACEFMGKDSIPNSEADELSKKIDELLAGMKRNDAGFEVIYNEIQALKKYTKNMDKKTWTQLLKGKLVDLVADKGLGLTFVAANDIFADLTGQHLDKLLLK